MKQDELLVRLEAATAIVGKVSSEVTALKEAILNAGNVTPEVEAALNALEATIKGVDDLNPDVIAE